MRVNNVAIHFCVERNFHVENEDSPWVVLLHGFGGGVFSWKRCLPTMLDDLKQDIRGVIAFDRVYVYCTSPPHSTALCSNEQQTVWCSEALDSQSDR